MSNPRKNRTETNSMRARLFILLIAFVSAAASPVAAKEEAADAAPPTLGMNPPAEASVFNGTDW